MVNQAFLLPQFGDVNIIPCVVAPKSIDVVDFQLARGRIGQFFLIVAGLHPRNDCLPLSLFLVLRFILSLCCLFLLRIQHLYSVFDRLDSVILAF